MTDEPKTVVKIGGMVLQPATERDFLLRMLLWGRYGVGKTTLASTAPAPILYLGFDHDGDAPLLKCHNLDVVDFSDAPSSIVPGFKSASGTTIQELSNLLKSRREAGNAYATVVFDSVSSFGRMALEHGVKDAKTPLEEPGRSGYGRKNTWINYMILSMLRLVSVHKCHFILICHEDRPLTDKEGAVVEYPIMLGSSLSHQVPISINEVWYIERQTSGVITIRVSPSVLHRHVKTRLFSPSVKTFPWRYDPETGEGLTLATIYETWKENGYNKIAI